MNKCIHISQKDFLHISFEQYTIKNLKPREAIFFQAVVVVEIDNRH